LEVNDQQTINFVVLEIFISINTEGFEWVKYGIFLSLDVLFLFGAIKKCSTNLEWIFLFCQYLSIIFLFASLPTPRPSATSLVDIRLFCITMARGFPTFS